MAEGTAGDSCRSQLNMCETAGEDKEKDETRPGQQQHELDELGELVELVVPS